MQKNQNKVDKVVSDIKWRINSGIYKPNEKIPSENSFAISFGYSRTTIRKALNILINEKFLVSRKAIGYFVTLSYQKLEDGFTESQKRKVQSITANQIEKSQFELLGEIGINEEDIRSEFSHIIIKTYYNQERRPFHVKVIFFNRNVSKFMTLKNVLNGVTASYYKENITIKKREQVLKIVTPCQSVRVKLDFWDKTGIPSVVAKMFDQNNQLVELALEYTIPNEFTFKNTIEY